MEHIWRQNGLPIITTSERENVTMDQKIESQKLTLSIPEAAKLLGISDNTMRQLARTEGFPAFNVGTRLLVSAKGLAVWVEDQAKKGIRI